MPVGAPSRVPDLGRIGSGLRYASIAASAALTNSTTETTLDSFALATDELKAGDVVHIRAQGILTATNSTDTFTAKAKIGSTVVAATPAPDAVDNDVYCIDAYVQIRTDGASGTLVSHGLVSNGAEGTATARCDILASTAVDTTAALTIALTGTWSVASAANSCRNDFFMVEILRPVSFD